MFDTTAPQGAPDQPSGAQAKDPAPAEDIEALRAAAARLATLEAKLADEREAQLEAKKRTQEDAEKAGELAKALEAAKDRLAELEPLEPLAQRWRSHEETQIKALDAKATSLPDVFKSLYARASDVEAKAEVIAAYEAAFATAPPPAKVPGQPPSPGAPAGLSDVDIAAAVQAQDGGKALAELKARDAKAVSAWFGRTLDGAKGAITSLGVGRFGG
jgi:DNA repair exonuclease SbcCD ATPase subunit